MNEGPDASGKRKPTALVVDDETSIRMVVARVLERAGFFVLPAADGMEGLEIAQKYPGPIDLAITHMLMPRLDGLELARHLVRVRPGIKTIVMSGYHQGQIVHEDLVLPVLQKPFDMKVLLEKVRETGCCGVA